MSGTIQPSIPPEAVPQTRSDTRVADARGVYASQAAERGASAGYKNSEIGTIPVDWDLHPLGSLYRFSNGVNADKEAYGQGTPFINVLEVITNSHLQERHIPGKVLLGKTAREAFAVLPGDVLFNRTSETQEEVGLSAVYCGHAPVVFGGFVIRGRAVSNLLDAAYAGYGLRALSVRRQIVAQGQGAIRSNIGQASLRRVQVSLPTLDEQCAIAEALSDVDGLLGALDALIAKKRAIKQAAMQQLLTGKTRLPGFSGAWESKRLGELGQFLKGSGVARADAQSGPLPCIRYGEIYTVHSDYVRTFHSWVSREVASSATLLQRGDLLFAGSGETKAEIGKCVAFVQDGEAYAGGDIVILRPRNVDSTYLGFVLNTESVNRQKASLGQGDAVVHISAKALAQVSVRIPSADEQAAIARLLVDMDDEIAALERRREKTRAIKQGMMQQLLTGRVRLLPPSAVATEGATR